MKKYQATHPWITFECDLRAASHRVWLMLGEAQSKCEHIAGALLTPDVALEMHQIYLVKGIFATTAIEGNPLNEEEVRSYLAGTLKLPPAQQYIQQEMDNVEAALDEIFQQTLQCAETALSPERVQIYNALVLRDLELEDGVVAGAIRLKDVLVGDVYRGAPPEDCAYLLERMCAWLNHETFCAQDDRRLIFGILRALLAHLYIAWIHPFGDGNGRTARLIEFEILTCSGVPSPAAHLLSDHYNRTRGEYYRQLDAASRSGGNIWPFLEYALGGFLSGLREQIERIRSQELTVAWRDYVHSVFSAKSTKGDERRRHLMLDMSQHETAVPLEKMRVISSRVAEHYAGKTSKTLARDLIELQKLDLIVKTPQGYRAHREIMLAFLPERRV